MKLFRKFVLSFIVAETLICLNVYASEVNNSTGIISGQLHLNETWEPIVYLSYIPSFSDMKTLSNEMIISGATLDSLGNFTIDIGFLPAEENLFRLHLVKKGDSPNTLIIGGKDENHIFFLANRTAHIRITNVDEQSLFKDYNILGNSGNLTFRAITKIVSVSNELIDFEESLLKRDLIEKATSEKLRFIADTCTNPMASLYAINQSDFESNYATNVSFYKSFLKKWKNNHSTYFETFRKQIPINKGGRELYYLLGLFLLITVGLVIYSKMHHKKTNRMNDLSVQERKIFALLQAGATNQEISDDCHIGLSTVKSHVSSIFTKLNINSRKEAMNFKNQE